MFTRVSRARAVDEYSLKFLARVVIKGFRAGFQHTQSPGYCFALRLGRQSSGFWVWGSLNAKP